MEEHQQPTLLAQPGVQEDALPVGQPVLPGLEGQQVERQRAGFGDFGQHLGGDLPLHPVGLGQRLALGLGQVEDHRGVEAHQLLAGLGVSLAALRVFDLEFHLGQAGGQDVDALLALLDLATQLVPALEPGHAGGGGALEGDQHLVANRVVVEATHHPQVIQEMLGVPLGQALHWLITIVIFNRSATPPWA